MSKTVATAILFAIALGSLANALWMLIYPDVWYDRMPVAMPDYGPFNPHLVRDVGAAYLLVAIILLLAAMRRSRRRVLSGLAAVFFGLHAGVHLVDSIAGNVDATHWLRDLPTTYLPAIALAWIACTELHDRG